ncbi:Rac exchanger 1 protein [Seminavis robusta]|uniref:Rac exchanger 1 protein n=1 Tax=Seminavis robusta TaxID=568900 RepID=A0A9N8DPD9_9STRA|nr:Rac exchanger 1 protein [Seminavis robusta]|eukprot:Sro191_g082360.1 Rac exchanger 1 protein (352) ;mRNA; f:80200-81359
MKSSQGRNLSFHEYFDIAAEMKRTLIVKDRKHKFRMYGRCFVGKEAVTFLKSYMGFEHRPQAVQFGIELNRRVQCWQPVTSGGGSKKQELKDAKIFFRFTDFESKRGSSAVATLEDIAQAFRLGMPVADRTYRFRTYKKCFTGRQAVDFLIKRKYVTTRSAAVALGRCLQSEFKLFDHVHGQHELKDENLFYRKLVPEIVNSRVSFLLDNRETERLVEMWLLTMGSVASSLYVYLFQPESTVMFLVTALGVATTLQRYLAGIRVVSTPEVCKSPSCKSISNLKLSVKHDRDLPALMRDNSDTSATSRDSMDLYNGVRSGPAVRNSVVEMKGWEMGTSNYFDGDLSTSEFAD